MTCNVCANQCSLEEGQAGFCNARFSKSGVIYSSAYGKITSISLDPIEKKPLNYFYPGSQILSLGSYGCNFVCPFCQNHEISMAGVKELERGILPVYLLHPEEAVRQAVASRDRGNIGLAFTYNEPLINYEYVRDCSILAREEGLKNVVVTNGSVSQDILNGILPWIAAVRPDIPLHLNRFFPRYKMLDKKATKVESLLRLAEIARKHLKYVRVGNC